MTDLNAFEAFNGDQVAAATGPNGKPSFTVDQAADQIVRGEPGWSSALGVGFTVTYAFRATAPGEMPEDATGFTRFNSQQIAQAELSMLAWSDVANISFVRAGAGLSGESAYSDQASILFANYTNGVEGAVAFASYPGDTEATSDAGDVWVNAGFSYNYSPAVGNYGAMTMTHEIGHAIGLAHPADYDAEEDKNITYSEHATYYEDSRQYTVMSYFSASNTGADLGGVFSAAPLLHDIAAAQLEYGANMTTRTGDTVYGFNSTAERPWYGATSATTKLVFAIWDAGGRDTLDVSGYWQNQLIDLRPGAFSNIGGLVGNVAVAQGVQMENAKGGLGADRIWGADFGGEIYGGGGGDTIYGGAGTNYLRGDDGDDSIIGGAGFDDINGNKGQDIARGGLGNDWVVGGQGDDKLYGETGNDIVYGNMGDDSLEGGVGADTIRGGQHDDVLFGGDGNDWLAGDRGADTITGGEGADTFYFFTAAATDRVVDFNSAEGDRVQLDRGVSYTVRQEGADAVIDLGNGDQLILVGIVAAGSQDWIFVA
ncbi:M10 family metallopeptidase C-terminal domain-containing protein [Phenylobacterium immobile]|uniref:M10 family metallopeptidase C-terminal domain-containing protein n=1 Tax=Phenylobacterium immobile TaxID=21 RepID=UPI000AC154A2|nr:M10 family metallopeptidase C-terminal domain-containing protein [Phenylobacterium immobile]